MVNLVDAFRDELEVRTEFPYASEVRQFRIPMRDGVHLSARAWLPLGTPPSPAIIEYIPYRHNDYTVLRDGLVHPWFAGHGYAALRVDLRGSGDSDGIPMDEYVLQEQDDALEVLAWIAAQPWSNGHTGVMGISWGGFNALQIAARQPPSLKAIVTVCSTDERYRDDVHYLGGCLISDNLTWGTLGYANMLRPPDPRMVGDRWRSMWQERLEQAPIPLLNWLSHPYDDAYWKHGSVARDYSAITCPVYAIGGWVDSYTNAIPRLMKGLRVPVKALIGPWGHAYPHLAAPGPRIGFLQEVTRWWDRWLKGLANGIDEEPCLTFWQRDSVPPQTTYSTLPGGWRQSDSWPPAGHHEVRFHLQPGKLSGEAGKASTLTIKSPCYTGAHAGEWMPLGVGAEMPADQRLDDGGAMTFDTEPLTDVLCITGAPVLSVVLSADRPGGQIGVRLNDVFPDGRSTRITSAVLNLTHGFGHEHPESLRVGEPYPVTLRMDETAYVIPAGHRLRLSVASAYWPLVWPAPQATTLSLKTSDASLVLPVCVTHAHTPVEFAPPAIPQPPVLSWLRPVEHRRVISYDTSSDTTVVQHFRDEGQFQIAEHGMVVDSRGSEEHRVSGRDPLSAEGRVHWRLSLQRDDWHPVIECTVRQTSDASFFWLDVEIRASLGEAEMFSRQTQHRIRRHLV